MSNPQSFRELYVTVREYHGDSVYKDVLKCWPDDNPDKCQWIEDFKQRTNDNWEAAEMQDLWTLYAIFRVTSMLLLSFQDCWIHGIDFRKSAVTVEEFQSFHEKLGFHVPDVTSFHPFYHEIISVNPELDDQAPIELDQCLWPVLMLGDMMFCRAGCIVSGGTEHVINRIAESSKLYWTYRRNDRPCDDLSHGWGSNSQWRTDLRRDYKSDGEYHFNVDARKSLNDPHCKLDMPLETMIELVRNRCLVRTQMDDVDLFPYDYKYIEVPLKKD